MEDISQEQCPKGGKHELVLLMNVYSITCKKCSQYWTQHIDDVLVKVTILRTILPPSQMTLNDIIYE